MLAPQPPLPSRRRGPCEPPHPLLKAAFNHCQQQDSSALQAAHAPAWGQRRLVRAHTTQRPTDTALVLASPPCHPGRRADDHHCSEGENKAQEAPSYQEQEPECPRSSLLSSTPYRFPLYQVGRTSVATRASIYRASHPRQAYAEVGCAPSHRATLRGRRTAPTI